MTTNILVYMVVIPRRRVCLYVRVVLWCVLLVCVCVSVSCPVYMYSVYAFVYV